ncbi:SDR family NAD(P)-dependent oxidoreductase [Acrocarpospora macrocephala]|uniref:Short-chain type dehydrogenase/reductase n=1 Tax=Acrocarpospora macrocephala TaxID=150177 RepID=A0A5M3X1T3_9ACTN|nr:SDR family NAD(P)-dependent oxidoreductase [Acrocarpospora macrocephala]GES15697.1 short-chain type dehydrogenase/reductase [Acrocarpospora macrocephala]
MKELDTKTALVTGAAGGIGLALAERFAAEGMSVVLADIDTAGLTTATRRLTERGAAALSVTTDVTDPASVRALAEAARERFGTVDVLCANAGVAGPWSDAEWTIPPAEWQRVFAVNVLGVVHSLAAFVPHMIASGSPGHIVVTTSLASYLTTPSAAPYFASKHAALSIVETLRLQLAARNAPIGVSVLCPDRVRTRVIERELAHQYGPDAAASAIDPFAGPAVLEPDQVAAIVIDGIRAERYLLLTHDSSRAQIQARLDKLNAGLNEPAS